MFCPCETRTSTCRNFTTISSGLWCFLGILVLLDAKRHTSGRTTSKGEDQADAAITLADGRYLKSLHDARTVLLDVSVNARSGALDHAIRFLLLAAETASAVFSARQLDPSRTWPSE